jgi:hypothetical protein
MSINLVSASATEYTQVNLFSIHGPPRVGKTHQATEITAGPVIGAVVNDPNSLPVLVKRGRELEKRGDKMIVIPHDKAGNPITFHLDASDAVLKDPAVCKAHYQKEIKRLFDLCEELLPQINGLIVDNDSDLQKMFDLAFFGGVSRPKVSDYIPRNKSLTKFYTMFLSAGVHTTLIHTSKNRWHTETETNANGKEKTSFSVIGQQADIFSGMEYKFNGMFELVKVEPHLRADILSEVDPGMKWYAAHGHKFRQVGNNDIILRCLNSTGGVEYNANECIWLSQPKNPKDLEYPDSITMDNVLGRLFPNIDLDYWR